MFKEGIRAVHDRSKFSKLVIGDLGCQRREELARAGLVLHTAAFSVTLCIWTCDMLCTGVSLPNQSEAGKLEMKPMGGSTCCQL